MVGDTLYNWLTYKVKVMANKVNVQPRFALKQFNTSSKLCGYAAQSFTELFLGILKVLFI